MELLSLYYCAVVEINTVNWFTARNIDTFNFFLFVLLIGSLTLLITRFKCQWSLYIPQGLTFTNSTFCPHSVFVLYGSHNKQRLLPCSALTDWLL